MDDRVHGKIEFGLLRGVLVVPDTIRRYADIRLADPFLKPFWRHERVLGMCATSPPTRCRRTDDKWIQGYRRFVTIYRKGPDYRDQLLEENPGLFYAYAMYDKLKSEPDTTLMLEARLLAGSSYGRIAHEMKTIPETVEWYERIFFNVIDFLDHHDWIVRNVLLPASDRFQSHPVEPGARDSRVEPCVRPHMDMTLKFFAYFGGEIVCDLMISGFRRNRKVTNPEDLSDYFNEQFSTQIQKRSAQAAGQFEVNKYNVMELFAMHTRLMEISKLDKDADGQHSDIEKNINALLSELPWTVGRAGKKMYQGTIIGKYDESSVELDAEEAIEAGAGYETAAANECAAIDIFNRKAAKSDAKSE